MPQQAHISSAVVKRLPGYYRHLTELSQQGETRISSQELSRRMSLTASQIRQDINSIGGVGQQGYGYHISELRARIGDILGLSRTYHMIILGAGNIGRAVAHYPPFREDGYEVHALFDISPHLIGTMVAGLPVQPIEQLDDWLRKHRVDIAVLSVSPESARPMLSRLAEAGVRGVWNFTPVDLVAPPEMAINNVHLSDSLQILSYRMREREQA